MRAEDVYETLAGRSCPRRLKARLTIKLGVLLYQVEVASENMICWRDIRYQNGKVQITSDW